MRNSLFSLVLLMLGYLPLAAQDFEAIDQYLESKVDLSEPGPGMAVGIVIDGTIVYEKYLGMANLEFEVPISAKTKFNIASNAKQFTALAILKLVEEGRLSLDDDIRQYLPELLPTIKEPITVLNLIHHSSGVRDYGSLIGLADDPWWKQYGLDNEEVYELLCNQQDLNFKPGTNYSYSNSNYTLLTRIVEQVTEQDFPDYAAEMFATLGLEHTLYPGSFTKTISQRATPYAQWGGDEGWEHYPAVWSLYGDGFLFTTLPDQLKWEQMLQDLPNTSSWVQKSQSRASLSPKYDYGFGVEFRQYNYKNIMRHAGSTGAYGAQFIRFPEDKMAIVVMGNSSNINYYRTAYGVADKLLGLPEDRKKEDLMPEVSDEETPISQWVGDYLRPEGQLIQFLEKDGNLLWTMHNEDDLIFTRSSGDVFVTETIPGLKYHFELVDGQAQFTGYYPGYKPRLHPGIAAAPPINETKLLQQKGTFTNTEVDITIQFKVLSDKSFEIEWQNEVLTGKFLRSDLWVVDNFTIRPEWNEQDQLNTLLVEYGGIENMRFNRQ
ncbi:MAG: serine hydrolase domain-containing protein [Bacteroidota bacterium]